MAQRLRYKGWSGFTSRIASGPVAVERKMMRRSGLILLFLMIPMVNALSAAQDQPAPASAEQGPQAPAPVSGAQESPAPTASKAPAGNFKYFFTATGAAFEAYMDLASQKADSEGNKSVTVKLAKFSSSFRDWIKSNFPGGETADYAIDSYSIDCEGKKVGEHEIVWYDANGSELTNYDFGGILSTPIIYSMKENLMKKMCGLP
jgi:hypothetical protein